MDENIKEFEKEVNKHSILMSIGGCIIVIITLLVALFINELLAVLIFVAGIGCVFWVGSDKEKVLKSKYKDIVVHNILKNTFFDFKYNYNDGFDEKFIADLNLFHKWKFYSSYDYISSVYKGVKFDMSNVHIKGRDRHFYLDTENRETDDYYLFGQWYVFEFDKNFKYEFIVATSDMIINLKCFKNDEFYTDSKDFNKMFKITVLDADKKDSFTIPDLHFLNKLMNIRNTLRCSMIFIFKNNKLHIGVNSRMTFFEQRKHVGMNVKREKSDVQKEIGTLLYLIDEFNGDTELFKQ